MKKRILIIAILLIIIIFLGNVIRNMVILSELSNKADNSINNENYRKIVYSYGKEETGVTEVVHKGDKTKVVIIRLTLGGTEKVTMYGTRTETDEWGNDIYNVNTYTETDENKTAKLNTNGGISAGPQNVFKVENFMQRLFIAITSSIKTTTYYGEECYFISTITNMPNFIAQKMYVSKNTGLVIGAEGRELEYADGNLGRWSAADYVYEFNTVTEANFVEPDVSEYEIQQ